MKNTHGGELLLVKLQALACNFVKGNITPWVLFMFFFEIVQMVPNRAKHQYPYLHSEKDQARINWYLKLQ